MIPRKLAQHRSTAPAMPRALTRPSTHARGYDRTWQKLRLMVLRREPLCRKCGKAAGDVDHILSIRRRPDLRLDPENLQALCRACHCKKTKEDNANA
jgi:5-methylcytosine-specific restriction protein A